MFPYGVRCSRHDLVRMGGFISVRMRHLTYVCHRSHSSNVALVESLILKVDCVAETSRNDGSVASIGLVTTTSPTDVSPADQEG